MSAVNIQDNAAIGNIFEAAERYLAAGLSVVPNLPDKKRPRGTWEQYQKAAMTAQQFKAKALHGDRIGIVCGKVSGNLELIDFDSQGESFEEFKEIVNNHAPSLMSRLVIERTPSGGFHVSYRCEKPVDGNTKLAAHAIEGKHKEEIEYKGKKAEAAQLHGGRYYAIFDLIETRGEGGQFVCAPSKDYELIQNDYEHLPTITSDERDLLINAAKSLNRWIEPEEVSHTVTYTGIVDPAKDFDQRADVPAILRKANWTKIKECGIYQQWRRPGKDTPNEWSASLIDGKVLRVYSTNAAPFTALKNYGPFAIYTHLECAGDYARAYKEIEAQGYGKQSTITGTTNQTDDYGYIPVSKLLNYKFENDPNVLVSDGWMTKSNIYGLIGQTGLGKSSFVVHEAVCFALGLPVFGLKPHRPLTSVIMQGENSERICAKEMQGVCTGVAGVAGNEALIEQRVHLHRESRFAGKNFHAVARILIERWKPDLFFIDPWFSFLGGNVSEQEHVSTWLRNGLMPLAHEFGVSFVVVHHANKPPRDSKSKLAYAGGDWSYFGAGSAEFANACRSILTIRESEGFYELRAAKNQEGWPLTESDEPDAPKVNTCFIQHGERGRIYWRRADPSAVSALESADNEELTEILNALREPSTDGKGWRYMAIIEQIKKIRGGSVSGAKTFFRRFVGPRMNSVMGIYSVKGCKVSEGFKQVSET